MTTGWQLDTDSAEAYERYLVPAIFEPFARALAAPVAGERVLDAACGTGVVARYAGPRAAHVVGVDVNAGMLAVAARIAPQLQWVQADVAALPFEDGSFDVVLCQQGLQFVSDRAAALAELRRVLAPGGRILASVWRGPEHNPGFAAFADVLDRHAGPGTGAVLRSPFAGGDGEAWRAALTAAGFRDVRVRIELGQRRAGRRRPSCCARSWPARRSPNRSAGSPRRRSTRSRPTSRTRCATTPTTTASCSAWRPLSSAGSRHADIDLSPPPHIELRRSGSTTGLGPES